MARDGASARSRRRRSLSGGYLRLASGGAAGATTGLSGKISPGKNVTVELDGEEYPRPLLWRQAGPGLEQPLLTRGRNFEGEGTLRFVVEE